MRWRTEALLLIQKDGLCPRPGTITPHPPVLQLPAPFKGTLGKKIEVMGRGFKRQQAHLLAFQVLILPLVLIVFILLPTVCVQYKFRSPSVIVVNWHLHTVCQCLRTNLISWYMNLLSLQTGACASMVVQISCSLVVRFQT